MSAEPPLSPQVKRWLRRSLSTVLSPQQPPERFEEIAAVLLDEMMLRLWHGPLEPEVVERMITVAVERRTTEVGVLCALSEAVAAAESGSVGE